MFSIYATRLWGILFQIVIQTDAILCFLCSSCLVTIVIMARNTLDVTKALFLIL